jgi:hypothetical protein
MYLAKPTQRFSELARDVRACRWLPVTATSAVGIRVRQAVLDERWMWSDLLVIRVLHGLCQLGQFD